MYDHINSIQIRGHLNIGSHRCQVVQFVQQIPISLFLWLSSVCIWCMSDAVTATLAKFLQIFFIYVMWKVHRFQWAAGDHIHEDSTMQMTQTAYVHGVEFSLLHILILCSLLFCFPTMRTNEGEYGISWSPLAKPTVPIENIRN